MSQRRHDGHRSQERLLLDEVRDERRRGHAFDAHFTEDALVFRIVHASDAAGHAEHALGDFAGYEIRIVLARGGHEHIGLADARILLVARIAAVAVNDEVRPSQLHGEAIGRGEPLLDDRHLVAALQHDASQIRPDFAAASDNDVHGYHLIQNVT